MNYGFGKQTDTSAAPTMSSVVFYSPEAIRTAMEKIGYPDYLIDGVITKLQKED